MYCRHTRKGDVSSFSFRLRWWRWRWLIGFYATWGWNEWGVFLLPSSQTQSIIGEQLVRSLRSGL